MAGYEIADIECNRLITYYRVHLQRQDKTWGRGEGQYTGDEHVFKMFYDDGED